jgi:DNA-binding response OmpR family regulator
VTVRERFVRLTPIEFDILHVLCDNYGQVVPIADLCRRVWDVTEVDEGLVHTAYVHMARFRKKLKAWSVGHLLHHAYARGYMLLDSDLVQPPSTALSA